MSTFLRLLPFLLIAVLPMLVGCCSVSPIPFDSAKWKGDNGPVEPNWMRDDNVNQPSQAWRRAVGEVRHGMLRDLNRGNHLKTTMTKADVEEILGPPDSIYAREEIQGFPNQTLWYYETWSSCVHCARVLVVFNDQGLYIRHEIHGQ